MDGQRFDALTQTLAQETSRRRLLRRVSAGLAGGVLTALGFERAAAVQAQQPATCNVCQRCVARFMGGCTSSCVQAFDPESCPAACCDGARTVCTILGECTEDCSTICPGDRAP